MDQIAKQIATFLGIGKAPFAPGTWGTLATLPFAAGLNYLGPFYIMGFVLLFTPISIWASERHAKNINMEDPGEIVCDEILGTMIALTWVPMTWQAYLLGFLLFRVLDITKPLFIGYLDRRLSGGLGIMADDIAAGIVVNIVLQYLYINTMWLGVQIG